MISKRETALIIILLILVAGTGYFVLFYRPMSAQINQTNSAIAQKTAELEQAILREHQYALLNEQNEALVEEWAQMTAMLPTWLDDADILRRLQKIIYPHQQNITVVFPDGPVEYAKTESDREVAATTGIYTVLVTFTVPYNALQTILQGLENENIDNRVINYKVELIEDPDTGNVYYQTTLEVDFLVDKSA